MPLGNYDGDCREHVYKLCSWATTSWQNVFHIPHMCAGQDLDLFSWVQMHRH